MTTIGSAEIEGMKFQRIGWPWRHYPEWLDRLTIFARLVRMAWRVSLQAVMARQVTVHPAHGTGETSVVTVGRVAGSGDVAPLYTAQPWAMEMEITADVWETTRRNDPYRQYMQLPTGQVIMVAVGDMRDLKRAAS